MTDDNKEELKTLMWTTMRYVDMKQGKSKDHEGAVKDFLLATTDEVDMAETTLKSRIKDIKTALLKS